ncbi:MAG: hypothetical protein KAV18_04745 [Candidatus Omnitrophica bacterium]|nr:hypothetical protein [Candidatus Omnitrophota bacterium]
MKKTALLFMIGIALFFGCDNQNINISEIKVWDKNFNVIKIINQPEMINEVTIVWITKEKVKLKKRPDFIYKIDIVSDGKSTRWLYDPSGYATVLSKAKMPIYKIEKTDKFNEIIIP